MWPRVLAAAGSLALASCGVAVGAPSASATPAPTPSTADAGGAMVGFLHAAQAQDNAQVMGWLATTADTTDLAEVVKVYSSFGTVTHGGVFWAVAGLRVTDVRSVDGTHAEVTLSGDIVWCLGKAVNDPTSTCAAVNGPAGTTHTYAAISADGRWKVDVDINASSQLDHNPQASPTASAPSPTPT